MPNPYFQFKQFTVYHDRCAMKVTTDGCLFGAWVAREVNESMVNRQWAMDKELLNGHNELNTSDHQLSTVNNQRFLDIGTGTGLLSLMVAQKNKATIDAVEIDEKAAAQAMDNVKASPFASAITVYEGDVTAWDKGPYDVILSNPPFYEKEIPSTHQQKNVAHHGEGLRLETLFMIINEKLKDEGQFYLLLPYKRKGAIETLLQKTGLYLEKQVIVQPTSENPPFRLLLKGGKQPATVQLESMSIYNNAKVYTPEFTSLLKDYYLYL
jgi:tRNA1Val (adenine37-N6)-methyltransferase